VLHLRLRILAVMTLMTVSLNACGKDVPNSLTLVPVNTAVPALTLPPSVTPFPSLVGEGPYLILRQNYDSDTLVIYAKDGSGRKMLQLPPGGHTKYSLKNVISPDGKWLAFHTGTVNIGGEEDDLPVVLNLLNMEDGSIKPIAEVAVEGYYTKLADVAMELKLIDPDFYAPIDGNDWVLRSTISDFQRGIYSVAWSPDSGRVAFAAQIDGISSDVYVYDMNSGAIQRLNDDVKNVGSILWSADGRYIVLNNSASGAIYGGHSLHVVTVDAQTTRNPKELWSGTFGGIVGWLSDELILVTGGTDTAGSGTLETINVKTGQSNTVWLGLYGEVAVDNENQVIALTTSNNTYVEKPAIYFFDFEGDQKKYLEGHFFNLLSRRGEGSYSFLAMHVPEHGQAEYVGIASDGTLTPLRYIREYEVSISPDNSWLLFYNKSEMDLYDAQDHLVETFQIPGLSDVFWKPDSKGLYYSTYVDGPELYYMSIPDGKTLFVDSCIVENCSFYLDDNNSVWLP
jgi:WD40 repeat protein